MITLDDLAAGVKARCAVSQFTAALPGGAWLDRGPDAPVGAYTIFKIERGEVEWISDATYLQTFTLHMMAYTSASGGGDPQSAELAMATAINSGTAWAPLRNGFVLCAMPEGYDGEHDEHLRQGNDVFVAAGQWQLTVQGNLNP